MNRTVAPAVLLLYAQDTEVGVRTVRTGTVIGLIAQVALLAGLARNSIGLSGLGWLAGLSYGVIGATLLSRALARAAAQVFGAANWVTLVRATLVGGVTALVADAFVRPTEMTALATLAAVALVLDGVDGWVARHTGSVTALGARYDMEVDAFLIFVLSVLAARSVGPWVLAIGLARYAAVTAGWIVPWLRQPVPPRFWRKPVAAIQGIVLTVAVANIVPGPVIDVALVVSMALLAESFGRDAWWQWCQRVETAAETAEPKTEAVEHTYASAA
jgi:phosphatidylglycerophosphate synthase